MTTNPSIPRLITFPPSSDCEVGRWALRHYGVQVNEQPNAPPFFLAAVVLRGGRKFPLLLTETMIVNGAKPIIDYYELVVDPAKKLIPDQYKAEIEEAFQNYNVNMGTNTVRWAYTHLLPHKDIMIRPLSLNTPGYQQFVVKYCYGLPKSFLWRALKLGPEAAEASLKIIQDTFEQVNQKLADGRPYLVGDRFTLADLAFSVSGAPLVLPDGYGGYQFEQGPVPTFEQFPEEAKAVVSKMRETPAGQFILRIYREERYRN